MKLFTCSKLGENHYLTELPGITYIYLYSEVFVCVCVWSSFCMNEIQSAANSLQKEVSQLLSIKTHIQGSKDLQGA